MIATGLGEIGQYLIQGLLALTLVGGVAVFFAVLRRNSRRREEEARREEWGDRVYVDGDLVRYSRAELDRMSLPERLAAFGVTDDWDRATAARDRAAMVLTLRRTLLSPEAATGTADAVLKRGGVSR